jgi:hypothetical protein
MTGARGIAGAAGLVFAWQAWQIAFWGWDTHLADWKYYLWWIQVGGGFNPAMGVTVGSKWRQMSYTGANPGVVLLLWIVGAAYVYKIAKTRDGEGKPLLPTPFLKTAGISLAIYASWYLFLSSRGWFRHQWTAYATLGCLIAYGTASWLDRFRSRWQLPAALCTFLVVVMFTHGRAIEWMGPIDEDDRWTTQEEVSKEIGEKFPNNRLFVLDWHTAYQVAYFLKRYEHNVLEEAPQKGDVLLCDRDSNCDPQIFARYCAPKVVKAGIGYCVF